MSAKGSVPKSDAITVAIVITFLRDVAGDLRAALVAFARGGVWDLLGLGLLWHALATAPFTKVEESFNVQALHDLFMVPFKDLGSYDHMSYPGVVPRSFIGPLAFSLISRPVIYLLTGGGRQEIARIWYLLIARGILALVSVHSLRMLRMSASNVFGYPTGIMFAVICYCQFHLVFWGSRFIANTFGMILANYAVACWINSWPSVQELDESREKKDPSISRKPDVPFSEWTMDDFFGDATGIIAFLIFGAIVFRLELFALLAPILVSEVFITKRINWIFAFVVCVLAAVISVSATVVVDSIMWRRHGLWPELEVFRFNVLEGRSKEYGTSPWHAYITELLPRIAPIASPIAAIGAAALPSVRAMLTPAAFFVAAMSVIGHKEWRFVMPVLPLVNLAAAVTATRVLSARRIRAIAAIVAIGVAAAGAVVVLVGVEVSSRNYPGGVALSVAHRVLGYNFTSADAPIIHLDNYVCQTGASRFGEYGRPVGWIYSKEEKLENDQDFLERGFTHLLTISPEVHLGADWMNGNFKADCAWVVLQQPIKAIKRVGIDFGIGGWRAWAAQSVEQVTKGRLLWNPRNFSFGVRLPIQIYMEPKVYLLQRKDWTSVRAEKK
ncbi:hypothetical protein HDU83_004762 [Entophlyctis luteolus]|nr:hypothetical protein HDU83_004762 [Entophlyctis luteolus]